MNKSLYEEVKQFLKNKKKLHNEDEENINPINNNQMTLIENIINKNDQVNNLTLNKSIDKNPFYLTFNDLFEFKSNKKYKKIIKLIKEEINKEDIDTLEALNNKEKFLFLVEVLASNIINKNQFFIICSNDVVLNSYINNKTLFKIAQFQNLDIEELNKTQDKHYKKVLKYL